jgi:hypothetical protein
MFRRVCAWFGPLAPVRPQFFDRDAVREVGSGHTGNRVIISERRLFRRREVAFLESRKSSISSDLIRSIARLGRFDTGVLFTADDRLIGAEERLR